MGDGMSIKQTPLHAFHRAHNARMVPFAGWDMPVQYANGIKAEHLATRQSAGLFDVSHMAQIEICGNRAAADLASLTPIDIAGIGDGRLRYSLFLNNQGGVLDDLMIGRMGDIFYLVVNAGRADHDIAHLEKHLDATAKLTHRTDRALVALQGPKSADILSMLGLNLDDFRFMQLRHFDFNGTDLLISRSGYTGEDGFEIAIPAGAATAFCDACLSTGLVTLAGLGARDTLRMEAGLPLWGHELDETITPVEAGLGFAISKKRRDAADFPGAPQIINELKTGPTRRLVGLSAIGARPVRDGVILRHNDKPVGSVTSGGFAPSLDRPAALGFVDAEFAVAGTSLLADTRGKPTAITVSALPFVQHQYFR
jgi:aminomethyltransferase